MGDEDDSGTGGFGYGVLRDLAGYLNGAYDFRYVPDYGDAPFVYTGTGMFYFVFRVSFVFLAARPPGGRVASVRALRGRSRRAGPGRTHVAFRGVKGLVAPGRGGTPLRPPERA